MALYRRTINTVGGPGQSIPDHGAQEALQAQALRLEIMKAKLAQQNFMANASFRNRKLALEQANRMEGIKRAEDARLREEARAQDEINWRRQVATWNQENKEFQNELKRMSMEESRREKAAKAREEEENKISVPEVVSKRFPELEGKRLPAKEVRDLLRQVAPMEAALTTAKTDIASKVGGFLSERFARIADSPQADLEWDDSDMLELNMLLGNLRDQYGGIEELDFEKEVRDKFDSAYQTYKGSMVDPVIRSEAEEALRHRLSVDKLDDKSEGYFPSWQALKDVVTDIPRSLYLKEHTPEIRDVYPYVEETGVLKPEDKEAFEEYLRYRESIHRLNAPGALRDHFLKAIGGE